MHYFMDKKNVEQYIEMTKDYEPMAIVEKLRLYLPEGKSLLELGMGPGRELPLLAKSYQVVGSDYSSIFVDAFKAKHTDIEVMVLDAMTMQTTRKFDCVYSNKVLSHLSINDFHASLQRQAAVLNEEGILFMTLWRGDDHETYVEDMGLRFTYFSEETIRRFAIGHFEVLACEVFTEMEVDDSLLVVLKTIA